MPRTPTADRTAVLTRPLAAAALLTALTACSAGGAPEQPGGGGAAAEAGTEKAQIATVIGEEIGVRDEPDGALVETLSNPNDLGADRVFLVERAEGDWLEVLLPVRPNGGTGWIRRDEVELASTGFRLEVDMDAFSFSVLDGEKEVRSGEVAIGVEDTPTPPGRYYFTELLKPSDPKGDYGAYAFGLSGFSPTLKTFAGGPGQLAVHGTPDESVLGTEVSHGCVRVSNDDITWMAEHMPLGAPVEISE
ncbi:L,D-transpeptidase [Nocardiopsis composta]|uniref:Lipoprotein-anchoring transpeptidase ErfK/SrfK n=1 Tax=Nocardiopsis composta TaxID=157465 RepID=A0A7W8QQ38_9ACTN|nr:L,D-transpeptidase [Nocardiopsis composta]MBB5433833.1 lipoprotein-anchoring transpeptidase ErfK/SrfK [Nocardiopsis composta]